jgi:hypothetical protein
MLDLWTGLIFNRNCSLLGLKFQQSLTKFCYLIKKEKEKGEQFSLLEGRELL